MMGQSPMPGMAQPLTTGTLLDYNEANPDPGLPAPIPVAPPYIMPLSTIPPDIMGIPTATLVITIILGISGCIAVMCCFGCCNINGSVWGYQEVPPPPAYAY